MVITNYQLVAAYGRRNTSVLQGCLGRGSLQQCTVNPQAFLLGNTLFLVMNVLWGTFHLLREGFNFNSRVSSQKAFNVINNMILLM